jgi:hypothetical protein
MPLLPSVRAQVGLIEIEILIGLSLLTALYPRFARLVAIGFFAAAAAASFYLGVIGESSCGCAGRVSLNPWLASGVDLAAIVALAFIPVGESKHPSHKLAFALHTVVYSFVIVLAVSGIFFLIVDDPWAEIGRLRGELITVNPPITDLGPGAFGDKRTFTVRLVNRADHTVKFYGATASCDCVATDDLPTTLSPGESRPIAVRMVYNGGKGLFHHRYILFTDEESQRYVRGYFVGKVTEPPPTRN